VPAAHGRAQAEVVVVVTGDPLAALAAQSAALLHREQAKKQRPTTT
jgi:hypothetical protein